MVEISFTSRSEVRFNRLCPSLQERIESVFENIEDQSEQDIEEITDTPYYSISIQEHRIIFDQLSDDRIQIIDIVSMNSLDSSNKLSSTDIEALLTEYSELRNEVRLLEQLQHQRVIGGLTAIGALIGYSLLSSNGLPFISLVPVAISLMFVITVRMSNATLYLGRHIYDIEQEIDIDKFGWESRFGGVIRQNERFSMWDDHLTKWVVVPQVLTHAIIISAYILLMFISLYVISESDLPTVWGFVPQHIAIFSYTILTIMAMISGYSFIKVAMEVQP